MEHKLSSGPVTVALTTEVEGATPRFYTLIFAVADEAGNMDLDYTISTVAVPERDEAVNKYLSEALTLGQARFQATGRVQGVAGFVARQLF